MTAKLWPERQYDPDPDRRLDWQARARCAETDPETFYPEKGGSTRAAKKVCRGCDVTSECLEYALENEEPAGVWGGMSERERNRILIGRRSALAA
jgi:WhiB family redox-sensing transcriptional regulator